MKDLYKEISQLLEDIINREYPSLEISPPLWEVPPQPEFGDFSSMVAMKIASQIKEEPVSIASKFRDILEKELNFIEKIEIVKPGFINIFFSPQALKDSLNKFIKEKDKFFSGREKKKVLIEFVSANPTGPLSVAHGRQAVVGDVLANILEIFGNRVVREYYINDEGRQIELLVESIEERIKEIKGEGFSIPKDGYFGDYIKDIAQEVVKRGKKDIRKFALSYILSWIKNDLKKIGVKFDSWVSQHDLIEQGKVEESINFLEKKGFIYKRDNALWFSSTKFGDDKDRVLKKQDGNFTYFASDIAYHREKIKRGFRRLINLWGPDHHGYIGRVKAALKALGASNDILEIIIIQLVNIKTKERMSRRKGTALFLSDLIKDVGKDAARFYYLTRRNSSPLEFDIELAKKASFDNPLYYIQYAHARICSIFRKAKLKQPDPNYTKFLQDREELGLLKKVFQFSFCLDKVYHSLEPVILVDFLREIAGYFHRFYEERRVLGGEKNVCYARLNLLEGVRLTIEQGLKILGIRAPKKM